MQYLLFQKKEKKDSEKKVPSRRNSKESEGSGATGSRSATPTSVNESQGSQGTYYLHTTPNTVIW